ncbi:hypothetical protein [Novosphingobium sp. M1R2S20]|uniref:DUF1579 domain-containing protein n=1 Tax=Novosphingobium rhizovicinum TaxID=3228928 RepID=A0ABV3RF04_9SPHN
MQGGSVFKKRLYVTAASFALAFQANAAEPGTAPVPTGVGAIAGCWEGRGEVMGKPVTMAAVAKLILHDAMLSLDAESNAIADPSDKYAAHLVFGGASKQPDSAVDSVTGFWADSFGGAFTASGRGESFNSGFDITYDYPEADFVNRWRRTGDRLEWQIVMTDGASAERPFARYLLNKVACNS